MHYSIRTEEAYTDWARRFILFHHKRHPKEMGSAEIEAFLSHLAVERKVSFSTQNQAKAALLFLYKQVLGIDLPWLDNITSAKPSQHLPVVLTPTETRALLHELSGTMWLIASMLYGTGMRLLEGLRLRIKDVEFERREIIIGDGKGAKDRVTVLPENILLPLKKQMEKAKLLHDIDLVALAPKAEKPRPFGVGSRVFHLRIGRDDRNTELKPAKGILAQRIRLRGMKGLTLFASHDAACVKACGANTLRMDHLKAPEHCLALAADAISREPRITKISRFGTEILPPLRHISANFA